MTDMQLNNIKSTCNHMLEAYRNNITQLLGYVGKAKAAEIENADIKEDLDTIIADLERQLNSLSDEMNVNF